MMKIRSLLLSALSMILCMSSCTKHTDGGDSQLQDQKLITGDFYLNVGYNTFSRTSDDGFILAATLSKYRMYVAKCASDFSITWQKTFGSCIYNVGGLAEASDHGFVIISNVHDTTVYPPILYVDLVKLNSSGDMLWEKKYRFRYLYETGFALRETPDHGFIITTTHDQVTARGFTFIELFKVNSMGDSLWSRDFPEYRLTDGHDVQLTPDNGFIAAGEYVIIKTDSLGNKQWGYAMPETRITNVRVLPDGSVIACGDKDVHSLISPNSLDYILMKFDAGGNELWEKLYDAGNYEWAGNLCLAADGGYLISGKSISGSTGAEQPVIIKTDAGGIEQSRIILNANQMGDPRGLVAVGNSYVYYGGTTDASGLQYYLMLMRLHM